MLKKNKKKYLWCIENIQAQKYKQSKRNAMEKESTNEWTEEKKNKIITAPSINKSMNNRNNAIYIHPFFSFFSPFVVSI